MTPEVVKSISDRYIELYNLLIGEPFIAIDNNADQDQIEASILNWFQKATII